VRDHEEGDEEEPPKGVEGEEDDLFSHEGALVADDPSPVLVARQQLRDAPKRFVLHDVK
jgi:hypothetical protein